LPKKSPKKSEKINASIIEEIQIEEKPNGTSDRHYRYRWLGCYR
jgi:hypothetical protein